MGCPPYYCLLSTVYKLFNSSGREDFQHFVQHCLNSAFSYAFIEQGAEVEGKLEGSESAKRRGRQVDVVLSDVQGERIESIYTFSIELDH